jgi:hypothetical protein
MRPRLSKMGPPLCPRNPGDEVSTNFTSLDASGAFLRTNLVGVPHPETEAFGVVKGDEGEAQRDASILAALSALGMQ